MVANLGKSRDVTIQVPPPVTILPPSPAPFFSSGAGRFRFGHKFKALRPSFETPDSRGLDHKGILGSLLTSRVVGGNQKPISFQAGFGVGVP